LIRIPSFSCVLLTKRAAQFTVPLIAKYSFDILLGSDLQGTDNASCRKKEIGTLTKIALKYKRMVTPVNY